MREPTSSLLSRVHNYPKKELFLWQKRSERVPLQFDQYYHHVAVTMKEHQRRTTMLLGVANQMFWGIDFKQLTMNLCLLPNVDLKASKQEVDEKYVGKFDKWLNTSPYGIWVTKFAAKQPYAECKYRHCCQKFNYDLNSTSSNIIKHLKRHHKLDYDLFSKKFLNSHRALASFSNVLSPQ